MSKNRLEASVLERNEREDGVQVKPEGQEKAHFEGLVNQCKRIEFSLKKCEKLGGF